MKKQLLSLCMLLVGVGAPFAGRCGVGIQLLGIQPQGNIKWSNSTVPGIGAYISHPHRIFPDLSLILGAQAFKVKSTYAPVPSYLGILDSSQTNTTYYGANYVFKEQLMYYGYAGFQYNAVKLKPIDLALKVQGAFVFGGTYVDGAIEMPLKSEYRRFGEEGYIGYKFSAIVEKKIVDRVYFNLGAEYTNIRTRELDLNYTHLSAFAGMYFMFKAKKEDDHEE